MRSFFSLSVFRATLACAACAFVAAVSGCLTEPDGFDTKPDGFDGLADKTAKAFAYASAGTAVTGERIDAGDTKGAKVANDLTAAGLPPPAIRDVEWFRKLAKADATQAELDKAKADGAKMFAEILTLRDKVAKGISPEEAQRMKDKAASDAEARANLGWAAKFAFFCALANAGVGGYFHPNKFLVAAVSGILVAVGIACSYAIKFLGSDSFLWMERGIALSLGLGVAAMVALAVHHAWKSKTETKVLKGLVESAASGAVQGATTAVTAAGNAVEAVAESPAVEHGVAVVKAEAKGAWAWLKSKWPFGKK